MGKIRKTLAKACALLMLVNTMSVNVYAQEQPTTDEGNKTVIEETTTDAQPENTEIIEETTTDTQIENTEVVEKNTANTQSENVEVIKETTTDTQTEKTEAVEETTTDTLTQKTGEVETKAGETSYNVLWRVQEPVTVWFEYDDYNTTSGEDILRWNDIIDVNTNETVDLSEQTIEGIVIVEDPDETLELSPDNDSIKPIRYGRPAKIYIVIGDENNVVEVPIQVEATYLLKEKINVEQGQTFKLEDLFVDAENDTLDTLPESITIDRSKFVGFWVNEEDGYFSLSEDGKEFTVNQNEVNTQVRANFNDEYLTICFWVQTDNYQELYRDDFTYAAVGSSFTKANMPAEFIRWQDKQAITINPQDIERFSFRSGESEIFELSEDGQTVFINEEGPVSMYAYMDGGKTTLSFELVGVKKTDNFYVPEQVYAPIVPEEAESVNEATASVMASGTSSTVYVNNGMVNIPLNVSPADAFVDFSVIVDGVKLKLESEFSIPGEAYYENDKVLASYTKRQFRQPVCAIWVTQECNVSLEFSYLDNYGVMQKATSDVVLLEDFSVSEFGLHYAQAIYAAYETEEGHLKLADSNDHPLEINVGDTENIEVVKMSFAAFKPIKSGNPWLEFPVYTLGHMNSYRVEEVSGQDVMAMNRRGTIAAGNPGWETLHIDSHQGDYADYTDFKVVVSEENIPTGEDSVSKYTMARFQDYYEEGKQYVDGPTENLSFYNCLYGTDDIFELVIERTTTNEKLAISHDAALIARIQTAKSSVLDYYGQPSDVFEILDFETTTEGSEGNYSTRTTVTFLNDNPTLFNNELFSVDLQMGSNKTLSLISPEISLGASAATLGEGVSQDLAGKIASPEDIESSFGVPYDVLKSSLPKSLLDHLPYRVAAVTTSIECKVQKFDSETGKLTIDLMPTCTVYGVDGEQMDETYDIENAVPVSLVVSDLYEPGDIHIRHVKEDGTVNYYDGTISKDYVLSFWNPDGFSEFEISSMDFIDPVYVDTASISLGGDIGVNFYLDIAEKDLKKVKIMLECEGKENPPILAYDAPVNDSGKRKFQMKVNAKEMHKKIKLFVEDLDGNRRTLKIHGDDTTDYKDTGFEYSVADYLEAAQSPQSTITGRALELVKATDEYGKYTQLYFDYPKDIEFDPAPVSANTVTLDDLSLYAVTTTGTMPEGISNPEVSLVLDSATTLRVYFKLADGELDNYAFKLDTVPVTPEYNSAKGKYFISVSNIAADKLDKVHTITMASIDGETTYTVNCSALSYAKLIVNADEVDEKLKDLVKALYLYNQAADKYVESLEE